MATRGVEHTKAAQRGTFNPEKPKLIDYMEQKTIAERAYFHWEARGHPWGSPDEDWFRAEREIKKEKSH
jgi:hypothetical protein